MSALAGRRVLVTRPRAQAGPFVAALEAAGAVPVLLPLLTIAPPDDARPAEAALDRLATYAWLVCTSANGARAVGERWAARGVPFPAAVRVAVVGPRTAAAASAAGLPVHAQPGEFRGAALRAALGDVSGQRVLLARTDIGREETPEALVRAGAIVDAVVFYRTIAAVPDPGALGAVREGVDILTFMSPSAVEAFMTLLGDEAVSLATRATVACIGPVTADAARAAGLPVHVQPATYTSEALLDALLAVR